MALRERKTCTAAVASKYGIYDCFLKSWTCMYLQTKKLILLQIFLCLNSKVQCWVFLCWFYFNDLALKCSNHSVSRIQLDINKKCMFSTNKLILFKSHCWTLTICGFWLNAHKHVFKKALRDKTAIQWIVHICRKRTGQWFTNEIPIISSSVAVTLLWEHNTTESDKEEKTEADIQYAER